LVLHLRTPLIHTIQLLAYGIHSRFSLEHGPIHFNRVVNCQTFSVLCNTVYCNDLEVHLLRLQTHHYKASSNYSHHTTRQQETFSGITLLTIPKSILYQSCFCSAPRISLTVIMSTTAFRRSPVGCMHASYVIKMSYSARRQEKYPVLTIGYRIDSPICVTCNEIITFQILKTKANFQKNLGVIIKCRWNRQ
jgi:hypothetical protein